MSTNVCNSNRMIGMKIDNEAVTGAVDDIVKTDKLPHARAGADGQSPSITSWGITKQRAFARHQSFDIGGTKSMSSA